MRDNGLPIHIATQHVTQVRLTIDGEPAIYLEGKDTPIVVEGTLEGALKKLEAALSGLRLVEEIPAPAPEPEPEPIVHEVPAVREAPALEVVAIPAPAAKPKPRSTAVKTPGKAAKVVASVTAIPVPAKAKKKEVPATGEEPDLSWFKGLR